MTDKSNAKCLFEGCDNEAKVRGLCVAHYHCLRRMIKHGKTTWAESEAAGICTRPKRSHPGTSKCQQWFEKKINAVKETPEGTL